MARAGRSLAAAIIGGLLLGYGARIAYGCNIGAFFSGIASGSLHGWLWLRARSRQRLGTCLRPIFGLSVERRTTDLVRARKGRSVGFLSLPRPLVKTASVTSVGW